MTAHAAKTVRLLVAEDNPLVRDLIQKGLDPHCEVVIAEDGGDALLKVIDEPPDVILCDYKMPGLNGRQLADAARATRPKLRVLFMTGYAEAATRTNGFLDTGMEMITKPFTLESMASRIRRMVTLGISDD